MIGVDLKPAVGIKQADYFLGIISILIDELSKYEEVEVCHKDILDNYKKRKKKESREFLISTLKQKARLEGISYEEILAQLPKEQLINIIVED